MLFPSAMRARFWENFSALRGQVKRANTERKDANMRGRKPKSPALKALQGHAGHRRLEPAAGPFVAGLPTKHEGLDDLADQEWDRLISELRPILCQSDRGLLLCAVDAFSQFTKASRLVQRAGATYTAVGENGSKLVKQHPAVRQREAARAAYQRALCELGCSPVSRARVKEAPAQPIKLTGVRRLLG
jgi:P27 family predicted phage terminase small subunit